MPVTTFNTLPAETMAALGFLFLLMIYIVFSLILHYHWKNYATDAKVSKLTIWAHFAITVPLILVMGLMTLIIY